MCGKFGRPVERNAMTLLELFVTLAMLAVVLLAAMEFLNSGSQTIVNQSQDIALEDRVQKAVTQITDDMREAGIGYMTISRRTTDSSVYVLTTGVADNTQDVICMATARDMNGKFRILDGSGPTSPMPICPQWQGLVAYSCYKEKLYRLIDWRYHEYDKARPYYVSGESGATISFTNGTTSSIFSIRRADGAAGTSQSVEVLMYEGALLQAIDQAGLTTWMTPSSSTVLNFRIMCVDKSRESVRKTANNVPVREVINFTVKMRN